MLTSICLKLSAPLMLMLTAATNDTSGPRYTAEGALIPPMEYREWVFLSSGLDMSYTEDPAMKGHSMFDNVFVDPASEEHFGFLNYMDAFEEIRKAVGSGVEIGYSTRDGLSRYVRPNVEQEAIRIF